MPQHVVPPIYGYQPQVGAWYRPGMVDVSQHHPGSPHPHHPHPHAGMGGYTPYVVYPTGVMNEPPSPLCGSPVSTPTGEAGRLGPVPPSVGSSRSLP